MTTDSKNYGQTHSRSYFAGSAARLIYRKIRERQLKFRSSAQYWEDRYLQGLTSGFGSYGRLAEFKSSTLNAFVEDYGVRNVVEWGCGDGAQLALARYPKYTGIDVSTRAVELCRSKFNDDPLKRFLSVSDPDTSEVRADLALSLDVIYHLVEDTVYDDYMTRLTSSAERFVCIYSSNTEKVSPDPHVRHRVFCDWMTGNAPSWELFLKIDNPFPEDAKRPDDTSWADFYFYRNRVESDGMADG
jgi:hypothetical protein